MSLDLYEIGVNLISDDGISTARDGVIGEVTAFQEVADRVNGEFGHSGTALAGLTGASADLVRSWNLATEAAHQGVGVADKPSIGGSGFVLNTSNAAVPAIIGDYSAIPWDFSGGISQVAANDLRMARREPALDAQYQSQFTQGQAVSGADVINAIDANAFGSQMGNVSDVMPGFGDHQLMAQHSSQLPTSDPLRLVGEQNLDRLGFEPVKNLIPDFHSLEQVGGGDITPQDDLPVFPGTGRDDWEMEGRAFSKDALRLPAVGAARDNFALYDPVRISSGEDEGGPDGVYDRADFEHGPPSWIPDVSEVATTRPNFRNSMSMLDALSVDNALIPDGLISADPLLNHGALQQYSPENTVLPEAPDIFPDHKLESDIAAGGPMTTFDRLTQSDAGMSPAVIAALDGSSGALNSPEDWTKTYPSIGSEIAMQGVSRADAPASGHDGGSSPFLNNLATGDSVAGAETDEASAVFGAEGTATTSGPPGWLVALTGAVVMELTSTMLPNNASAPGGPTGSRQNQLGPSGTRNDPLHVRVLEQPVPYKTHMPAGPTSTLPSQSLPIPGQVLFSP